MVIELNQSNWQDEVVNSDIPVLVDMWGEGCQPCKALSPLVDELSKEYTGRVKFGKLNIYDYQALAVEYRITSIPTTLIFKGGDELKRIIGLVKKKSLSEALDAVLAS